MHVIVKRDDIVTEMEWKIVRCQHMSGGTEDNSEHASCSLNPDRGWTVGYPECRATTSMTRRAGSLS